MKQSVPVLFEVVLSALVLQAVPAPRPSAEDVGRAYYLFLQARIAEDENDLSTAIDNYRQAIAILPDAAAVRLDLADLYIRQNQIDEAEREVRAALAADPANRLAHRLVAAGARPHPSSGAATGSSTQGSRAGLRPGSRGTQGTTSMP